MYHFCFAQLQRDLEVVMQSSDIDVDQLSLDFTASITQSLTVTTSWKPLIDIKSSFKLEAKVRPNEMTSTLAMTNLIVVDQVSDGAVLPNLLSWQLTSSKTECDDESLKQSLIQEHDQLEPMVPFSLYISKSSNCLKVRAKSLPVEFCLNKPCVQEMINVMMYVVDSEALFAKVDANVQELVKIYEDGRRRALRRAYIIKQRKIEMGGEDFDQRESEHDAFNEAPDLAIDVSVELHAPKIIIPQDCCNDSMGCLRYFVLCKQSKMTLVCDNCFFTGWIWDIFPCKALFIREKLTRCLGQYLYRQ